MRSKTIQSRFTLGRSVDPWRFNEELIIARIRYWEESHRVQNRLIKERDEKGRTLNKSLDFKEEGYPEGVSPYKRYQANDLMTVDEYYKKFDEIEREYERQFAKEIAQLEEKYQYKHKEPSIYEVMIEAVLEGCEHMKPDRKIDFIMTSDNLIKDLAISMLRRKYEMFEENPTSLKEFVEGFANWHGANVALAEQGVMEFKRKKVIRYIRDEIKRYMSEYIDEIIASTDNAETAGR